ncbi:hypothetical protein D5400_01005 [Georhizobium profundi]|uniref:DUF1127 domain-containing protein n=1 Tax=Georhizobium profundi TaxID=2341112 RepID=A0A3S9AZA8_9HYPH|nr:hypothetical protein D5400_01005 [Georhizobium profundi]
MGGVMLEEQKFEFVAQDAGTRVAAVSHGRDIWLYRLLVRLWKAPLRAWHRRYLASLSDRQLLDAGIDLTRAGRGRGSAARLDPNLEGLR